MSRILLIYNCGSVGIFIAFLAVRRQPYKSSCPRKERERSQKIYSLVSLVIKTKVVQNVNRMSEIFFSLCQYVRMSICQYVRMQLFSLGIKMKVVQNVIRTSDSHYVNTSVCQYVSMSVCQYVSMSVCQYVNMSIYQYVNMSECNFSA